MELDRMAEIGERVAAATEGPWGVAEGTIFGTIVNSGDMDAEPLAVLGGYVRGSDAVADADIERARLEEETDRD